MTIVRLRPAHHNRLCGVNVSALTSLTYVIPGCDYLLPTRMMNWTEHGAWPLTVDR